jgi:virginiamycin B lyase
MQSRYQKLMLGAVVVVEAMGVAKPALAQTVTEFPIPTAGSSPSGITGGPDGALWFTETQGNKIGRITTAGVITEFPIPTPNSQPNGITTGPDGALWFAETAGETIGRITTDGVITEFPTTITSTQPYGITNGPGDALWFSAREVDGNQVGRMTTYGQYEVISDRPPPGYIGTPFNITVGPDGALWFAECAPHALPCTNSQIGRMTWEGSLTQYPAAGVSAYGITVGPDGALWFTDSGPSNQIGRITTAGAMTEFPVPSGSLGGITVGPDGALWFASALPGGNTIGRITTAGVATQFSTPGDPLNITTGPDGALWFTEYDANKIGRLVLTANEELLVNPTTNMVASGTKGVAFTPSSFSYTLSTPSGSAGFSISGVPEWLTPSVTSGTTSSGTTVTFSVNSKALNLAAKTYDAAITFTNKTNGLGTQTRVAILAVDPLGIGTGGCGGDGLPNPPTITPGKQTQVTVNFYCIAGPSYVADPLTIEIAKLPSGASFSPKTTTTDITGKKTTTITITAGKTTRPATYDLEIGGAGKACTRYSAHQSFCWEPLTIAPLPNP